MQDIHNREDIHVVVHQFYKKLMAIPEMNIFFAEEMAMDLESHLDIIVDFWNSALLGGGSYKGNVMYKHIQLDKIRKLEERHFNIWVDNWIGTLEENYIGEKTEEAKTKAINIKNLMLYKIKASREAGFIQ